jgi:hypothetical protein
VSDPSTDRLAVEATLYRYGTTIDRKDYAGLRALLADEATVTFGERPPLVGADAAVAFVRAVGDGVIDAHHHLTVYEVEIDADSARALTYVTAHQVLRVAPGEALSLVGRYHDRLAKRAGRWLITEKRLDVVFRGTVPSAEPSPRRP